MIILLQLSQSSEGTLLHLLRACTAAVLVMPFDSPVCMLPHLSAVQSTECLQVTAAQRMGVPVVHPDWLVACKFGWAKQPEAAFLLPGYAGMGPGGFNGGSSRLMTLGNAAAAAAEAEREKQAVMKGAGRTNT